MYPGNYTGVPPVHPEFGNVWPDGKPNSRLFEVSGITFGR
jgi:hypothetical protein